jgi:hypothetical protein
MTKMLRTIAVATCLGSFAASIPMADAANAAVVRKCAPGTLKKGKWVRTGPWHSCGRREQPTVCVHHRTEAFRHYGRCRTPSR